MVDRADIAMVTGLWRRTLKHKVGTDCIAVDQIKKVWKNVPTFSKGVK